MEYFNSGTLFMHPPLESNRKERLLNGISEFLTVISNDSHFREAGEKIELPVDLPE